MPIRLNIQDIKERLSESDLNCLDEVYRNPYLKMGFECLKGHLLKISWADIQKLIKKKSPHCPICKHGDSYFEKKIEIPKIFEAKQYISSDGEMFNTKKELTKYNRKLRAKNVPHEMAIKAICDSLENARKYKFRKRVIETIAKWNVIWELRESNKLSDNDLPEEKIIKKEIRKTICTLCDGDSELCQCNEGSYTHYGFVEEQLKPYLNIIPDAYVINEHYYTISAIEVEDTHRVPVAKLIQYAVFGDCLDWSFPEWKFQLFLYDRFANKMGEINLPVYYMGGLSEDISSDYKAILEECERILPKIEGALTGYYKTAKFKKF